jgi:hypothetical protein
MTDIQAICQALNADSGVLDKEIPYPPKPHPAATRKKVTHKRLLFLGPLRITKSTNGKLVTIIRMDEKAKKFIFLNCYVN